MVGGRRVQPRPVGLEVLGVLRVHSIPKKIRGVISDFADVALSKAGGEEEDKSSSLAAFIKKAKEEKNAERFAKYLGTPLRFWLYQYVENFHCKPDSIEDMTWGLRYLIYNRGEK
jgi:hypothetical protein